MKTLIALAAAATLLGMSAASAQTTMNAGSKSSGRYCVQDRDVQEGQPSKCFSTMAACRKEAIGTGTCVPNPRGGTTGSGMKHNTR